jgi:hypothetical protein
VTDQLVIQAEPELLVIGSPAVAVLVITEPAVETIALVEPGPQGPPGTQGLQGPPGQDGRPSALALDLSASPHYALYPTGIARIDYATAPATVQRSNSTDWANRATLNYT